MKASFAERFDLKPQFEGRTSFGLNPHTDVRCYINRDGVPSPYQVARDLVEGKAAVRLALSGVSGSGKTHWLHACAHACEQACPDLKVIYLAPELRGFVSNRVLELYPHVAQQMLHHMASFELGVRREAIKQARLDVSWRHTLKAALLRWSEELELPSAQRSLQWSHANAWLSYASACPPSYPYAIWGFIPDAYSALLEVQDHMAKLSAKASSRRWVVCVDSRDRLGFQSHQSLLYQLYQLSKVAEGQVSFILTSAEHYRDTHQRPMTYVELGALSSEGQRRAYMERLWCAVTHSSKLQPFLLSSAAREFVIMHAERLAQLLSFHKAPALTPRAMNEVLSFVCLHAEASKDGLIEVPAIKRAFHLDVLDEFKLHAPHKAVIEP